MTRACHNNAVLTFKWPSAAAATNAAVIAVCFANSHGQAHCSRNETITEWPPIAACTNADESTVSVSDSCK